MPEIKERVDQVKARMHAAAERCGRAPSSVQLIAVSKTVPVDMIRTAIGAGVDTLGENYVQEARGKHEALADLSASWHFIGHLQRNKAKYAVRLFELIHTVDSLALAQELDKQAAKVHKRQKILIQVNVGYEATKFGVAPEEAEHLIRKVRRLENVQIQGLMTMPPFFNAPEKVRPYFAALKLLYEQIKEQGLDTVEMRHLSMGMTGDFEAAIEEGATLVRVGTAIFGERL